MAKFQFRVGKSGSVVCGLICFATLVGSTTGAGGASTEVIANRKINGTITLSVDDGTAGGPKVINGAKKPVPVREQARKGVSYGSGRVGDWNSVAARADANQGAPAAAGAKAEVTATSEETSQFTLKHDGRKVDMKVVLHWIATLSAGKATVEVAAAIAGAGSCNLNGTYTLETDGGNPNRIDVTGYQTLKMVNGGGSSDRVITAPQCTLNAGDFNLTWSVKVIAAADPKAEVNVDRVILSLGK
jgi:hypothetical protein